MVQALIATGVPNKILPLAWRISASDTTTTLWDVDYSDGYQVHAVLTWIALDEEREYEWGVIGACIKAVEGYDRNGDPAICHLLLVKGN